MPDPSAEWRTRPMGLYPCEGKNRHCGEPATVEVVTPNLLVWGYYCYACGQEEEAKRNRDGLKALLRKGA
jgi:hypothetical protein